MTAKERYVAYLARKAEPVVRAAKLTLLDYRKLLLKLLSLHASSCACVHCTEIRAFLPERKHTNVPHGFLSLTDAGRIYGYSQQALNSASRAGRLAVSKYKQYKIVEVSEIERYVRESNTRKGEKEKISE